MKYYFAEKKYTEPIKNLWPSFKCRPPVYVKGYKMKSNPIKTMKETQISVAMKICSLINQLRHINFLFLFPILDEDVC